MKRKLGSEEAREAIREAFLNTLPVTVTRLKAEELTGGLIAARRLRDLDSEGRGPSTSIRLNGRTIAYPREVFVDWLMANLDVMERRI